MTSSPTLIKSLDFILENCVKIQMPGVARFDEATRDLVPEICKFCTVGGHHPFMAAVIKACEHYDKAVTEHGEENVTAEH